MSPGTNLIGEGCSFSLTPRHNQATLYVLDTYRVRWTSMAKRRRRHGSSNPNYRPPRRRQRVATHNARAPILLLPEPELPNADRRRWNPTRTVSPPAAIFRDASRITVPEKGPMHIMQFADPKKVVLCKRRAERKEVMFALRKTGKGSRAKQRRRNQWSDIKC